MQRKLNVRLLAIVAAALFITAVVSHYLHAYQLKRNAHLLLEFGDEAAEQKKYGKALNYYSQYLAFMPGDVDTLRKYCQALDARAGSVDERVELVLKMEEVLRAQPGQNTLRMRLVHNLIWLDRIAEAVGHLHKLKASATDKAEVLHMLGWCEDALQHYPEAAAAFHEAIRINPKQIHSYALLAEVEEERLHDSEAAQKTLDALVEANPESYQAYLCRARFYRSRGDEKSAAGDLAAAQRLGPDRPEVLLERADAARAQGQWEEARRLLKDGMKRFPDHADFVKRMAGVEIRAGKTETAIDHLRTGMQRAPASIELAVLLVDLLIDQKELAEAKTRIDELVKAGVKLALADYLKARLLIVEEDYPAAIARLEKALDDFGPVSPWNGRAHLLLGYCYRHTGDDEKELQAFRRAVQDEPSWATASVGLGEALLSAGRVDEAVQTLEPFKAALELPAEYWKLLGRARFLRQLRLPASERRWDKVEEALAKAAANPADIDVPIWRADMLAARGDFAQAEGELQKARAAHPSSPLVPCALADLEIAQNHCNAAEKILDQAVRDQGDALEIRLARCRLYRASGDFAKLALLDQALPTKWSAQDRAGLERELARTWTRLGNSARAESAWKAVAADLPGDSGSRSVLVELALKKNQPDIARKWRDELRGIEGQAGVLWRYADAAILVHEAFLDRAKLDEARARLKDIESLRKDWPKVSLLAAKIFELQGNHAAASEEYARALERGDIPAASMARLIELLIRRRDFSKAESALEKYDEKQPLDSNLMRLGADVALGLRDKRFTAIAVLRAEQAVPMPARDYRDALWLAGMYQAAGENGKAEKLLEASLKRDRQTPDVWIAWIDFLAQTDRRAQATAEIDTMKSALPSSRQALAHARALAVLGQIAAAAKAYEDALAAAPNDGATLAQAADFYRRADRPEFAAQAYRRLLDPALHVPPDVTVGARRQLAILLAARDRAAAWALLEENNKIEPDALADRRVRWFIQGQTASARNDAIGRFEESLKAQPPTPNERLLLARLYEGAGNFAAAREQLAEAADEAPREPFVLAPYIHMLIRTGDLDDARRQFARLEALEPASPRTLAAKAALQDAGK